MTSSNARFHARMSARDKAEPVIELAKHISTLLPTANERRGFWSRLKREMTALYYSQTKRDQKELDERSRHLNPKKPASEPVIIGLS